MKQRKYETKENEAIERIMLSVLEQEWKKPIKETPPFATCDGIMYDHPIAIVECKYRPQFKTLNTFNTVMVSHSKWVRCQQLAKEKGVPFIFLLAIKDTSMYWVDGTNLYLESQAGGRTKNAFLGDIEDCVYIPIELFKPVTELPEWLTEGR